MVSQSTSRQDSPVDPWEGIGDDSSNIHGSPTLLGPDQPPCHLDVRLTRHKAAWMTPQCVQQELRDLAPQVPAVGDIRKHLVADTASPLSPSPPSLGDSLAETSLSEDTADSVGSASAQGLSEKSGDSSLTSSEEWVVLPGLSHLASLLKSSKMLATSPCPEVDGAFFNPSHLTASADEGNFSR